VCWDEYATCYDLLCSLNPAYTVLVERFRKFLEESDLPGHSSLLDLGAGTGNFFCFGLPAKFRDASLTHLDANHGMVARAMRKYRDRDINVRTILEDASRCSFEARSFDCILSINALYAMPNPRRILARAYDWLKPGGFLFVVDLGRIQSTLDWTVYLLARNARGLGIASAISILRHEGRVISKANRAITVAQRGGAFWRHSTAEFGEHLAAIGFEIVELLPCYRGYSDLAICRKPDRASTAGAPIFAFR
jgi:ubiquinone/menaquinone biosynthesis C-methylase UbiE